MPLLTKSQTKPKKTMDTVFNNFKLKLATSNFFFVLSNIKYNETLQECSTIAALFFPNQDIILDSEIIIKSMDKLNMVSVNIIYITLNKQLLEKDVKTRHIFENKQVNIYFLSPFKFQELISLSDYNEYNYGYLFISDCIIWSDIIKFAKSSKASLSISGGSSNKRHVVSKLDSRLNTYLLAILNLDYPMLNSLNDFNGLEKFDFLPYVDYSNKKEHRITDSEGNIFINSILTTKNDSDNVNNSDSVNGNASENVNKLSIGDIVESDK